jgi:hypothetical protein
MARNKKREQTLSNMSIKPKFYPTCIRATFKFTLEYLEVEKIIIEAKEHPTQTELWKSLSNKMRYQTFKLILKYLEASGKIVFGKTKIIYTGVNNPKLEALMKSSVQIR